MSFVSNLFGTIAGGALLNKATGVGFIPKDANGGTITIKGDQAVWLGLKNRVMQKYTYDYCSPVSAVVDRLAEYDITGKIEILRAKGKGKENFATGVWAQNMKALLTRPNPLQSWEQFRGQQVIYKKIFGFCPVLPFIPSGMSPDNATSMINLPPWLFEVVGTRKMLYTSKIEEVVKEYRVNLMGQIFSLKPDQIFILEDSFMQDEESDFLLPQSRLVGLDMDVSNCCAAKEADNVLLKKKGPLGVWSHDAAAVKDSMSGYVPMSQEQKGELQDSLQQYGLSLEQYQYVISRTAIKWLPTSFNVAELQTKETVIASEKSICHRFAFPYVLYEETDATFANSSEAATAVYVTNVIPNNVKDMNKYNMFFKGEENNSIIKCDYSDIPALQEDKAEAANTEKTTTETVILQFENNIITRNEMRVKLGLDTIPGQDVLKKDEAPEPTTSAIDANTVPLNVNQDGKAA